MNSSARVPVQAVVILGFALAVIGSVVDYFFTITQRAYHFSSFKLVMIPLMEPLIVISALVAWWWLTRIEASDGAGSAILRRAFLAFAAQYGFTTVLWLFVIIPFNNGDGFWPTTAMWFDLIGALITTTGLFLLSRTFSASVSRTEPIVEIPVVS